MKYINKKYNVFVMYEVKFECKLTLGENYMNRLNSSGRNQRVEFGTKGANIPTSQKSWMSN